MEQLSPITTTTTTIIKLVRKFFYSFLILFFTRTGYMKEVPLRDNKRNKSRICSAPLRVGFEILFVLLVFIPLFLFLFTWPNARNFIHGKVLSVIIFFFFSITKLIKLILFHRKHDLHQCQTVLTIGQIPR
jgi:hypothetical protein